MGEASGSKRSGKATLVKTVIGVLAAVLPFRRLRKRRQAVEDRGPINVKHSNIVT